jgi:diguanylate cyclase (GGDEF)-like protein
VTEALARPKDTLARAALLALLAAGAIVGIAVLDWLTGTELSLTALYLVPVALLSWFLGRAGGRAAAVVAGVSELVADAAAHGPAGHLLATGWNAGSVLVLSWVVAEVLTRLHESLDVERELARTDALTGAANSRSFAEAMELELERVARYGGVFSVAYLDLDRFKLVNDTLGHDAGDRLLRDVARAIGTRLRHIDTVARIGGDEFVVLLPATDESAACAALDAVRQALAGLTDVYGPGVKVSIGAVTFAEPPGSVDEALRVADSAMYRAKYAGRDRIVSLTLPDDAAGLMRG